MNVEAGQKRVPSQERAQRTRQKLVLAGQQEFSEAGYGRATAKSIAERAGVATGSFYQYFTDKDALLQELTRSRLEWIADRSVGLVERRAAHDPEPSEIRAAIAATMRSMVEIVMDYHREDPGLHSVITERRHADHTLEAMVNVAEQGLVNRVARLLSVGNFEGDADATAFVLFGMVEGSIHAHVLGQPTVSDERFVEALVAAMLRVALPAEARPELKVS